MPLALHPVMTFTGTPATWRGSPAAASASPLPTRCGPIAEALVVEMGGEPEWIEEGPAALPRGARRAAPTTWRPWSRGDAAAARCGVEHPDRMLGPLLGAALDNALRPGDAALTGPVARGDAGTVAAHLRELRTVSPEALAAYVAMARPTADRALAAGLLSPRPPRRCSRCSPSGGDRPG